MRAPRDKRLRRRSSTPRWLGLAQRVHDEAGSAAAATRKAPGPAPPPRPWARRPGRTAAQRVLCTRQRRIAGRNAVAGAAQRWMRRWGARPRASPPHGPAGAELRTWARRAAQVCPIPLEVRGRPVRHRPMHRAPAGNPAQPGGGTHKGGARRAVCSAGKSPPGPPAGAAAALSPLTRARRRPGLPPPRSAPHCARRWPHRPGRPPRAGRPAGARASG